MIGNWKRAQIFLYSASALLLMMVLLLCSSTLPSPAVLQASRSIQSSGVVRYDGIRLQWLYVSDNKIMDSEGEFFLVGVNVRGQAMNPIDDGEWDDWHTYREIDAQYMSNYGFNSIRLVVNWGALELSATPDEFVYDTDLVAKLKETVAAYNAEGIYVIIDLHTSYLTATNPFIPIVNNAFAGEWYTDTSSTSAREHLKRVWLMLSDEFKDNSGVGGYDLCNEPHLGDSTITFQQAADYWFDMCDYVIDALRANGDNHMIIINMAPQSRYTTRMSRKLNDDNVLYEIHFYQGIDESALTVTENDYDWMKSRFDDDVNAKMIEFDVPFWMGEQGFGGATINEDDDRDVWLKNALTIFKTSPNMIGWSYWCWYSYGGGAPSGSGGSAFFGDTLVSYASDKPIQVHFY